MASESFPYSKHAFVTNLVFLSIMIGFSILVLLLGPIDPFWATTLIGLELLVLIVLGLSPFLTSHEISKNRIILRQGWYFRSSIDMGDIESIRMMEKGPSRTGVFFRIFESSVYVTTQKSQLIVLRLKGPKRFGWILGKKATRVIFDTSDPQRFLAAMEKFGAFTLSNPVRWS